MMKLNKKAVEKIFSLWWFVSLVIVGAAIVVVVLTYFGTAVDTRDIEASMLQEKIMDCIVKNGYLKQEIIKMDKENFLEFCKINKNLFGKNSVYLINLTIYNSTKHEQFSFITGEKSYQQDCAISQRITAKSYPFCISSNEAAIYFNLEKFEKELWSVYLLVASNNYGYKEPVTKAGGNNG